ncbi:putative inactive tyrosine-protein kinase Wsck [Drosophila sulfurigaster albostrigata]|uniref:putative inactive tyrosine-protein kinase Wsck n=1 Tax=Drosophila sulfurigaster albostrigata TaxID=89887 RepID=UPI002D21C9D3|nr:putative inactive tyrosine-protein kinase Wsck [Drosophila sulfurigaster albostrigata]
MQDGHRPIVSWYRRQASACIVAMALLLCCCCVPVSIQQQLEILASKEPVYYYVGCYTARTDLLKESVYAKTPQTCIEICEHQDHRYAVLAAEKCFCANQLEAREKQDDQLCHTRCMANKAQYCGGVGVHSYYSTTVLRQPAPHHLRVVNSTENSLSLAWDAYDARKVLQAGGAEDPLMPQQHILNFRVKCHILETYSILPPFQQPEFIVQSSETGLELTDLQPATLYNVSVLALCAVPRQQQEQECGHATLLARTEVGLPSPVPKQPKVLARTPSTITVELTPVQNNNGPVSKLLFIVEFVDDALSQPFDTQLLGSWQEAQQNGVPYYIAAELDYDRPEDNRTMHFVIGDGKRYGRYRNVPLDQLTRDTALERKPHVHISLGVVSTLQNSTKILYTRSTHEQHASSLDDFSYATFEKGQSSVVALAVTCIIFGSCLILSLITYFYLRYKTCHGQGLISSRRRNAHEMTTQQTPIIERENNGYLMEDDVLPASLESFKQQLQQLVDGLERQPRNALRLNVNDVIGSGRYGEIISGRLTSTETVPKECALHVLSMDDLNDSQTQAHLLRELRQLKKLKQQRNELLQDFYGISSSADWFYFIFELHRVSLKRRLIESRQVAPAPHLTSLTEQLVLQWMYELSSALSYLGSCQVIHRQLSGYSVYVNDDCKLKLSYFGPPHYVNGNGQQLDPCRWLAPEVLRHGQSHATVKSDVWSFACVAWECCALGGTPYANIPNSQQLLDAIRAGVRPAQPVYVYADLYQLLLNCWQLEPSERIGFEDVSFGVRQLMTSARHALCFDRLSSDTLDTLPLYLPMLETQI